MAYYKKVGSYRRRQIRRRRYRRGYKAGTWMGTAQRALRLAQSVKKMFNTEYKTNVVACPATITSSGSNVNPCAILQGDDWNQRNGRTIRAKSLRIFGNVSMDNASTKNIFRIIVFKDLNVQNGALVGAFPYLTAANVNATKNLDPQMTHRYVILMDKTYNMENAGKASYHIDHYFRLDHHIAYASAASTSFSEGTVIVALISDSVINHPICNMEVTLRYIDN